MKSIQSYKSIDELQEQAKIWMLSPCRVLNDIDDIEVINFYVASSILINQRLRELANLMGIEGFLNQKSFVSRHILYIIERGLAAPGREQ